MLSLQFLLHCIGCDSFLCAEDGMSLFIQKIMEIKKHKM